MGEEKYIAVIKLADFSSFKNRWHCSCCLQLLGTKSLCMLY